MITVKNIYTGLTGVTVGQRKDGSRAVLFEDNSIEWLSAVAFGSYCDEAWLSSTSILAEGIQS